MNWWIALAVMALEFLRYAVHEIRHGHLGRRGLLFEHFLANEVLAERYGPLRLKYVLHHVLFTGIRKADAASLNIVLRMCPGRMPLNALSRSQLLELQAFASAGGYSEAAASIRQALGGS